MNNERNPRGRGRKPGLNKVYEKPDTVQSFTVSCTPNERQKLIDKHGSLTNVIVKALKEL